MEYDADKIIAQLYEMVAKEQDYEKLRALLTQLIQSLDERQRERDQRKASEVAEELRSELSALPRTHHQRENAARNQYDPHRGR